MKIVVIGATGATGRLVVDQAIQRGHHVVAYIRRTAALEPKQGLSIVVGQLEDQVALGSTLRGADAVLCCLGTHSLRNVTLMQKSLPLIARAMQSAGVDRLILLSAYGVGETARTASSFARFLYRTIVSSVYNDKAASEVALARTDVKWTGIYPVILTNGPLSEAVDVRPMSSVHKVSGLPKVSRADVARAMLDAAENESTIGQRLLVTAAGTVR